MATLVEQAQRELEAVEAKIKAIKAQLEKAERDRNEWLIFLDRAGMLATDRGKAASRDDSDLPRIKRSTWIGRMFEQIDKKGPMTTRQLAEAIIADGNAGEHKDPSDFAVILNSAAWRRKDLLRRTDDGKLEIATDRWQLVDSMD